MNSRNCKLTIVTIGHSVGYTIFTLDYVLINKKLLKTLEYIVNQKLKVALPKI